MPKMAMCGSIRCFLHDSRGVPRITLGPSWDFFAILIMYAGLLTFVQYKLLRELLDLDVGLYIIGLGLFLYLIGIYSLLHTFLGDPGIPEEIFLRYSN